MDKSSLRRNSSSSTFHSGSETHRGSQGSRHQWSSPTFRCRKQGILGRKRGKDGQTAARKLRLWDDNGLDVTPLPLHPVEPPEIQAIPDRYFLVDMFSSTLSDNLSSTSSFSLHSSSLFIDSPRPSSLYIKDTWNRKTEDSFAEKDINLSAPYLPKKTHDVKQRVTDRTLDEAGCILLETDAILLLDMPCTLIAEDAEDAEATRERNLHYVDLCKNRMGNEKYVERSMQTFNGVPKTKQIQSDKFIMVDKDTLASVRDMYESFCQQDETTERKKAEQAQLSMSPGKQKRKEKSISSFTGSTVSSLDMEMLGISLNAEPDFQEILLLESFKNSLLVTERSLVANMFQPKLAAYRELPVLEDPDSTAKPDFEEQSEEDKESSLTPHLECLWVFSCELTKGYSVTCMTWNKENPDYLAVGYRDCDSGLICYWSLNNVTLPQRVFHCHDIVTSLDFSANKPDQLAVGMRDGTIAIYNVQFQGSAALLANNSNCTKKHVRPVWQITWTKQELRSVWEDRDEVLISVSADGRVTKWFFASFSNSLDCLDLMKLKRVKEQKKKTEWNKKKNVMSKVTPVLCVDFHPTDSGIYLVGTWEGSIHKCHYSNNQRVLETYQKHFCPVNHVEWSPFSPDVFLSCSSDWTVQLWKQDSSNPVLSFTSIKSDVYTATWSPKWPTVFGVINRQQVEIWDLNSSIVLPTIVHHTMPFVKLTCLLFAKGTDCILVGDTGGQVSVYKLNNLNVGEGNKVDSLDDIIQSAVARCI